jgi:small subunit ribosomal protein S17e
MGRIKTKMIKRATRELMKVEDIQFREDFETNKKMLKGTVSSKKVRNKIAGYLARLVRASK